MERVVTMSRTARTFSRPLPLLDRLMELPLPQDQELTVNADRPRNTGGLRSELLRRDLARLQLDAIRRDLEVLFNTRRPVSSLPDSAGELRNSLIEYGLPAVRGSGPISPSRRERLRQEIESAIQRFEPRLVNVRVSLDPSVGPLERLRLRIDASLTGAGPLSLPASLDFSTGRFGLGEDSS
jgi:type VI secretion system lysozyme-like protein